MAASPIERFWAKVCPGLDAGRAPVRRSKTRQTIASDDARTGIDDLSRSGIISSATPDTPGTLCAKAIRALRSASRGLADGMWVDETAGAVGDGSLDSNGTISKPTGVPSRCPGKIS